MKHFLMLVVFLLHSFLFAQSNPKYIDFTAKTVNGLEMSLSKELKKNTVILVFVSTRCPVSNAYNERMAKIFDDFKNKGFTIIGINSNHNETVAEIKEHARANHLNFEIIKDEGNKIADLYHAGVTPEVFVISKKGDILYHGRIDDSRREDKVRSQDLRLVLNAIILKKNIPIQETKAFGCSIKRM